MTRGTGRKQFDTDVRALNAMWNEWDPIGLTGHVQDEYESQAISTLSQLQGDISEAELASDLAALLVNQFGIDPGGHEDFAREVVMWWRNERKLVEQ